eukprot:tig00000254_g22500.t1
MAGPGAFSLIETVELKPLGFITQLALAFIAFSAGAELYLPELREVLKSVGMITAGVTIANVIISTLSFHFLSLGFHEPPTTGLLLACALLATSIIVSLSPATTIAVVKETRAKGPFTSTLLGLVVVCDVVVLILFAISSGMTRAQCCGGGFSALALLFLIVEIIVSMCIGVVLGKLMIFFLWLPSRIRWIPGEWVGAILILPAGFLMFIFSDLFVHFSEQHGREVTLEPLLICIVGAYVATNQSKHRFTFIKLISKCGPFIFIPFFTFSGCQLKLGVMLKSLGFAIVTALVRAVTMAIGAIGGGIAAKSPPAHTKHMWLTLIAQSGVSMGLASKVGIAYEGFGPDFATAIVSVILINLLVGPVLCKVAIKRVGEARTEAEGGGGEAEEEGEEGAQRKFFVLGADGLALALARRFAEARAHVVVAHTDEAALKAAEALGEAVAQDEAAREKAEAEHGGHHGHGAPRKARVEARPIEGPGDLADGLRQATRGITKDSCEAVVLALQDDQRNYEAAQFFRSYLHIGRIVARVTNPAWRAHFSQIGVIPISDASAAVHLFFHAAHTPARSSVHVLNGKPTPGLFASLFGKKDGDAFLLPMTDAGRQEWARAHPAPEAQQDHEHPAPKDEHFFMYMSSRGEDMHHSAGDPMEDLHEHHELVPTLSAAQHRPNSSYDLHKSGTQSSLDSASTGLGFGRETSSTGLLSAQAGARTPSAARPAAPPSPAVGDDVI